MASNSHGVIRPMKGEVIETEADFAKIIYPLYGSIKLDGIRSSVLPERGTLSSSFKLIPNVFVRTILDKIAHLGPWDGELLTLGDGGEVEDYNTIQSKIMTRAGRPNFQFRPFDYVTDISMPYRERYAKLEYMAKYVNASYPTIPLEYVRHQLIGNRTELDAFIDRTVMMGHEGACFRHVDSPYKNGRSTLKQSWLLKYKPMKDTEGIITDFVEGQHNQNDAEISEFGLTRRSSHKAGMVASGTLGKFVVSHPVFGEVIVGPGRSTHALRQEIWDNSQQYIGKMIKFRYMEHGMKNKPRHPIFLGFRHPDDM